MHIPNARQATKLTTGRCGTIDCMDKIYSVSVLLGVITLIIGGIFLTSNSSVALHERATEAQVAQASSASDRLRNLGGSSQGELNYSPALPFEVSETCSAKDSEAKCEAACRPFRERYPNYEYACVQTVSVDQCVYECSISDLNEGCGAEDKIQWQTNDGKTAYICGNNREDIRYKNDPLFEDDGTRILEPCVFLEDKFGIDSDTFWGRLKYYVVASAILATGGDLPCPTGSVGTGGIALNTPAPQGGSGGGSVTGGSAAFETQVTQTTSANPPSTNSVPTQVTSSNTSAAPSTNSVPTTEVHGVTGTSVAVNPSLVRNSNSGFPVTPVSSGVTVNPVQGGAIALQTQGSSVQQNSAFESLRTNQQVGNARSLVQEFVGDPLRNFVRSIATQRVNDGLYGSDAADANYRQTPQGQTYTQPVVVYNDAPRAQRDITVGALPNSTYRSIQEIASDAAMDVPQNAARVEQFAYTLSRVGGPSTSVDTENESFGRLQDLIVEDEAIRALRVAEEEGKRAKNAVFCRVNETSASCQERREERAKEVERDTFVAELDKRVLPETAIEHFIAVYDGWVRPSPAPATRATSTLGALAARDAEETPRYEGTDGVNFVSWFIDSVTETTRKAVGAFADFFTSRNVLDEEEGEDAN